MHTLRDLTDAGALSRDLDGATSVVVLGAGFLGLELAAAARAMGKHVVVVEAAPSVLARAVGSEVGERVRRAHEDNGTTIVTGVCARRVLADEGRAVGVELSDGQVVAADVVLVAVGATPCTALAERLGLAVADGIVVDDRMLASDGRTLAVGDCANGPQPTVDETAAHMRLESVDSAIDQAEVAAATILGLAPPVRRVPWFWSDQGDLKLHIVGLLRDADSSVVRRYDDQRRLAVLHYRRDRLVAAEAVNAPADAMSVRRALEKGISLCPTRAADVSVPLKALLTA